MLESSRSQLSRVSSRLTQTAGLTNVDLAAEVVAFSYGAIGAAVEVALEDSIDNVIGQLRGSPPHALTPAQVAASAESTFTAFLAGEQSRGRFAAEKAIQLRTELIKTVRGSTHPAHAPSMITMSGVPHLEHFRAFFDVATNGADPRGPLAQPSLQQLIGRIGQIRGPRNDFAHDCSDPTQHELVVGRTRDLPGLAGEVAKLQQAIADLLLLVDVLELACTALGHALAGHPPATAPGREPWWRNGARHLARSAGRRLGVRV
jgi:hypothetical protein